MEYFKLVKFLLHEGTLHLVFHGGSSKNHHLIERRRVSLHLIEAIIKDGDSLEILPTHPELESISFTCEPLVAHELFHLFNPIIRTEL